MALRIEWSDKAEQSYLQILDYLHHAWTEKEVGNFVRRTEQLLATTSEQPHLFKRSQKKNIHKAFVVKQNSLFYKVTDTHIYLLEFWDNLLDPSKNKY